MKLSPMSSMRIDNIVALILQIILQVTYASWYIMYLIKLITVYACLLALFYFICPEILRSLKKEIIYYSYPNHICWSTAMFDEE